MIAWRPFSSHRLCGSTGGSGVAPARQRDCFRAGASIRISAKTRRVSVGRAWPGSRSPRCCGSRDWRPRPHARRYRRHGVQQDMAYDHLEIETRWQRYWDEHGTFRATRRSGRPKRYVLDMFPYPSGVGLHVGHPEGYTATDIMARAWRMRGYDVLHPMGWDAFGLPAEQHAIETGQHPAETTANNIATFKRQLKMLGFSYDWSREIDTTDPGYVRWTQWIFLQLFRRGLAYQATVPVNWCPALGTVLANEEAVDGKSERGGHPVY